MNLQIDFLPACCRPQCRQRSSQRRSGRRPRGTGPCWTRSAGRSYRTHRRRQSRASCGSQPSYRFFSCETSFPPTFFNWYTKGSRKKKEGNTAHTRNCPTKNLLQFPETPRLFRLCSTRAREQNRTKKISRLWIVRYLLNIQAETKHTWINRTQIKFQQHWTSKWHQDRYKKYINNEDLPFSSQEEETKREKYVQREIQQRNIYLPITYYWTVPLILDNSYHVGELTSSKIADTEVSGF